MAEKTFVGKSTIFITSSGFKITRTYNKGGELAVKTEGNFNVSHNKRKWWVKNYSSLCTKNRTERGDLINLCLKTVKVGDRIYGLTRAGKHIGKGQKIKS